MAFELDFLGADRNRAYCVEVESEEFGKKRFLDGGYSLAGAAGSLEMPSGKLLKGRDEFEPYCKWKENNPYHGKQFSILGDSISTLEGYNPRGYNVFYTGDNCKKTYVKEYKDTWWGKVINFFGGDLLINNSWSGSRVTKLPNHTETFPSGCSDQRTSNLHIDVIKPDVILVYLGTNDWASGVIPTCEELSLWDKQNEVFEVAYATMLQNLKQNYPNSEIWCCTLCETFISQNSRFVFPPTYAGIHIEEYNALIRSIAKQEGCKLIDLYQMKIVYDSVDGSHPNAQGMRTLASAICETLVDEDGRKYLSMGTARKPEECLLIGKKIDDQYRIWELLDTSREGAEKIYLSKDSRNREYFVKCICKTSINDVIKKDIIRTASLVRRLSHPYIRKSMPPIEDEDFLFDISEYVAGQSLEEKLDSIDGPLAVEEAVRYAIQIATALEYLHSLNPPIIHRDIKPRYVLIDKQNNVKLFGFDIAMEYYPQQKDQLIVGTKGYAAPEQYNGNTTPKSDIYSLGVLMHQLLTGMTPEMDLSEPIPIRLINPDLPEGLEYIIKKCTRSDPMERYQNCDELLKDLNNYMKLPKKSWGIRKLFRKKE